MPGFPAVARVAVWRSEAGGLAVFAPAWQIRRRRLKPPAWHPRQRGFLACCTEPAVSGLALDRIQRYGPWASRPLALRRFGAIPSAASADVGWGPPHSGPRSPLAVTQLPGIILSYQRRLICQARRPELELGSSRFRDSQLYPKKSVLFKRFGYFTQNGALGAL